MGWPCWFRGLDEIEYAAYLSKNTSMPVHQKCAAKTHNVIQRNIFSPAKGDTDLQQQQQQKFQQKLAQLTDKEKKKKKDEK